MLPFAITVECTVTVTITVECIVSVGVTVECTQEEGVEREARGRDAKAVVVVDPFSSGAVLAKRYLALTPGWLTD